MKDEIIKLSDEIKRKNILLEERLKADFDKNNEYFKVIFKLIYNKNFDHYFDLTDFKNIINKKDRNFSYEYIDNINIKYINNNFKNDDYIFFDKLIFKCYQEFNEYPNYIYICKSNFLKNIDKEILEFYIKNGFFEVKKGVLEKNISEKIKIILNFKVRDRMKYGFKQPYDFEPPRIVIQIQNQEFNFRTIFLKDKYQIFYSIFPFVSSFLFHLFFINHNDNNLLKIHNEPKSYQNLDSKEYILENTLENIKRFNKFINLYLELYKHYFIIFEDWLIEDINPELTDYYDNSK